MVLVGPRQVGKTTLARRIGREVGARYFDLEDPEDRARLADPRRALERLEDRLVILDEIHRAPELLLTLRGVVDRGRESGRDTGRFLILGSASLDVLRSTGETLAGRATEIDLGPSTCWRSLRRPTPWSPCSSAAATRDRSSHPVTGPASGGGATCSGRTWSGNSPG